MCLVLKSYITKNSFEFTDLIKRGLLHILNTTKSPVSFIFENPIINQVEMSKRIPQEVLILDVHDMLIPY